MNKTKRRHSEIMQRELLEQAAKVFVAKGFAGTSLQEVADALGVSRPSLYYHFSDKETMLARLIDDVMDLEPNIVQQVMQREHTTQAERLVDLVRTSTLYILERRYRFRLIVQVEESLTGDLKKKHERMKFEHLSCFKSIIETGIQTGEFPPQNSNVAAFSLIGMANWSTWWFNPDGEFTADEIAEIIAQMSLSAVSGGRVATPGTYSVHGFVDQLERNVANLKKLINGPG